MPGWNKDEEPNKCLSAVHVASLVAGFQLAQPMPSNSSGVSMNKNDRVAKPQSVISAGSEYRSPNLHKPKKAPGNARENRVNWTDELIAKLGTATDLEIANIFGTSKSTITKKRLSLGIPPYLDPESTRTKGLYTPDVISSFDKKSDREIAARLGVSKNAVKKTRKRLSIRKQASVIAQNLDALFTPEVISQLGVISDVAIAKQLGCDSETVRSHRVKLGIEPVIKMTTLPSEAYPLLGTMPDKDIAKSFNVGIYAVGNKRRSLGIAAFKAAK